MQGMSNGWNLLKLKMFTVKTWRVIEWWECASECFCSHWWFCMESWKNLWKHVSQWRFQPNFLTVLYDIVSDRYSEVGEDFLNQIGVHVCFTFPAFKNWFTARISVGGISKCLKRFKCAQKIKTQRRASKMVSVENRPTNKTSVQAHNAVRTATMVPEWNGYYFPYIPRI